MYGPFDAVFLPINDFRMPRVLGAGLAVPIHYGAKYYPEYIEVKDPEARFPQASATA